MKWNLIQTKVLGALLSCLIVSVGGTVALMHYSFMKNAQALAVESVTGSKRLFNILAARETSKMTAVSEALLLNPQVRDALAAKDRAGLVALTAPLYPKLKTEGITNWLFHTPEPNMAVFLRLHNLPKFGDHLNRFIDKQARKTHAIVTGNELAKAGFALRILRPVYDARGGLAGYLEFGEELGRFIRTMKSQTGDDYGLLLNKKFLDKQFWAESSKLLQHRDNWDDSPNVLMADKTTDSGSIMQFDGDLTAIPADGKVLEWFNEGDSVRLRGIFPIADAAGNAVGAMFVVRDISAIYLAMKHTQRILVSLTLVSLVFSTILILILLHRLIFRRLQHIILIATRVVGGDYEAEIKVHSADEVGQFEQLFEQFRRVFIDLMAHLPELQEKR